VDAGAGRNDEIITLERTLNFHSAKMIRFAFGFFWYFVDGRSIRVRLLRFDENSGHKNGNPTLKLI
jgi:hypothetical protein